MRAESQLDIVNSLSDRWVTCQSGPEPSNVGLQDPTLAATINGITNEWQSGSD